MMGGWWWERGGGRADGGGMGTTGAGSSSPPAPWAGFGNNVHPNTHARLRFSCCQHISPPRSAGHIQAPHPCWEMIHCEQIQYRKKASLSTEPLRNSIWVNERVGINYELNPRSTLPPCTALHFRAQRRLLLPRRPRQNRKYCLTSSGQRVTPTTAL